MYQLHQTMLLEGQPHESLPLGGLASPQTSRSGHGHDVAHTVPETTELPPVAALPEKPETPAQDSARGTAGAGGGDDNGALSDSPAKDINLELTSAADWGVNDTLSPVRQAVVPPKVRCPLSPCVVDP